MVKWFSDFVLKKIILDYLIICFERKRNCVVTENTTYIQLFNDQKYIQICCQKIFSVLI